MADTPNDQNNSDSANSKSTRQKFYQVQKDLENYDLLCLSHKEILSGIYDFYMDFSPSVIRKIFLVIFNSNKVFRQILVNFIFYHSIWWSTNSITNNLAINYSLINPYLFAIIVYFNYYEFLINQILLRYVLFYTIKSLHLINHNNLRCLLSRIESFLYFSICLAISIYMKFYLKFSIKLIVLFSGPHLFFMLYNHFDINVTILNFCLFTNELMKPSTESYVRDPEAKPNRPKNTFVYSDCSNMSIDDYLKSKINVPSLLAGRTVSNASGQETSRSFRHSTSRGKNWSKTKIFKFFLIEKVQNIFFYFLKIFKFNFKKFTARIKFLSEVVRSIPRTSQVRISKRNSFNFSQSGAAGSSSALTALTSNNNFVLNTNLINLTRIYYVHHKCQRDASSLREENELLRFEFTTRLKECLMRSIESIYFIFVLTRLCVPQNVNVRSVEYFIYLSLSIISTFISFFTYYIPASFIVSLNRNAEHLGKWVREEREDVKDVKAENFSFSKANAALQPVNKWMSSKIYFRKERVTYDGSVYQAATVSCVAIPGNKRHETFYDLFCSPMRIVTLMFFLQIVFITLLVTLVFLNRRWYSVLINIFELLFNSHTIFIVFRDFFVFYFQKKHLARLSLDIANCDKKNN
ncbi:transmembrane 39A isoform X1 [Brachionus plicatilis]|uniref:Transmembrane 39A isoform X1 n=1 Tax=Brachionus plicatilis TaxID=10195 RepID=A0A3M7QTQ8_BRAPC|nr:transmembrane 39A isoform X1 [Brachionus plicatilis]